MAAAGTDSTITNALVLVAGAWLGSLLPDADRAGSRVYRPTRFERRVWPARILGWIARLPLRALSVLGHRGLTHSLAAAAVAAVVCWALAARIVPATALAVGAGIAIGYGAHVAADACTPSGVPLFAPLSGRRWWLLPRPGRIPTGSARELAVAALFAIASVTMTAVLAG